MGSLLSLDPGPYQLGSLADVCLSADGDLSKRPLKMLRDRYGPCWTLSRGLRPLARSWSCFISQEICGLLAWTGLLCCVEKQKKGQF